MAFRLVWFWRYELLWPRGFSRRGRRGGHAHAASPQRGSMLLSQGHAAHDVIQTHGK